jgi:hypothetical protein
VFFLRVPTNGNVTDNAPACDVATTIKNGRGPATVVCIDFHLLKQMHVLVALNYYDRCATATNDTNPSLTINYPCYRGLSAVRITNRDAINNFKLVFVKSPPGTTPTLDYTFTGGMTSYLIPGPSA